MSTADYEATIIAAVASSPTQMPAVMLMMLTNLIESRMRAERPEVCVAALNTWRRICNDIMETRKAREIVEEGLDQ